MWKTKATSLYNYIRSVQKHADIYKVISNNMNIYKKVTCIENLKFEKQN